MTKTPRKPTERVAGRIAVHGDHAHLIGLAAKATGRTHAQFIEDELIPEVKRILRQHGTDADKALKARRTKATV